MLSSPWLYGRLLLFGKTNIRIFHRITMAFVLIFRTKAYFLPPPYILIRRRTQDIKRERSFDLSLRQVASLPPRTEDSMGCQPAVDDEPDCESRSSIRRRHNPEVRCDSPGGNSDTPTARHATCGKCADHDYSIQDTLVRFPACRTVPTMNSWTDSVCRCGETDKHLRLEISFL